MAVKQAPPVTTPPLICLSSDTKPSGLQAGHLAYETDTGAWYIYNGTAWVTYSGPPQGSFSQSRSQFIANILAITGDTRLFWLANGTDTTTSTDVSLNGRTITWDATVASRLSAQGLGYMQTFNGTTNLGTTPDADGLSFGDGSTDSAFTMIALANVTNTAAARAFAGKFTSGQREWSFNVAATDLLRLDLWDESADGSTFRQSNAAITHGVTSLFAATYSAATGGATAANDISLYTNGLVVASTATNDVNYTAMENGTSITGIGVRDNIGTHVFSGSMGLVLICQKALTASEHWAVYQHVKAYFGL